MVWDRWKKGFDVWEDKTAKYVEKWMKSPLLLTPSGAMLSATMKVKTVKDRATSMAWSALGLPSKHDQERTLHALNQIQSRLLDLEERLAEKDNSK